MDDGDTMVTYRWQYCRGGADITNEVLQPMAEADVIRAWEGAHGDFCLVELTRDGQRWVPTGGDGGWLVLDGRDYLDPDIAVQEMLPGARLAVCGCDQPGGVCGN